MASRELSLFADLDQGRLVSGFLSTLQATLPRFVFGDSIPVSLRPLKSNGNNSAAPWREVDLTGKAVRIAIGNPAGAASSGTFTLTYESDTTTAIPYSADGATIQSAFNLLPSIIAAGGVAVTRASTGAFRVIFDEAGSRTPVTSDTAALYPSSAAEIRVANEGDGTNREIVVVRIETLPAAYAELEDEFPAAAASVTEVRAGSVSVGAILSLDFTVIPYSGFYTLAIGGDQTLGIPWDSNSAEVQSAVELLPAIGSGKVSVTGDFPLFTLSFDVSLADIGAMTVGMSGLVVPQGRSGTLNTNTAAMIELLNGSAQATAKLEIELYDIGDATTWTVLQTECTVIDDVIGNLASTAPAFPSILTLMEPGGTAPTNFVQDRIEISGITYPTSLNSTINVHPELYEGKKLFAPTDFNPGVAGDGNVCFWNGLIDQWIIATAADGISTAHFYSFEEDVATPDLVTVWYPATSETGTVSVDYFAGSVATLAPPYFRTAGGFLYAQEAGVWKKAALSSL